MSTTPTLITEQTSGARWIATPTGTPGARAFWVLHVSGTSSAQPGILGFYAASLNAACDALNN